jgi:hypothetical protein
MTPGAQDTRAANGSTAGSGEGEQVHANGVSSHHAAGNTNSVSDPVQQDNVPQVHEAIGDVHMADANGTGAPGAGSTTGSQAVHAHVPPKFTLDGTPYAELYSDQAWEDCAREFIRQACSLMGTVSSFRVCEGHIGCDSHFVGLTSPGDHISCGSLFTACSLMGTVSNSCELCEFTFCEGNTW